MYSDTPPLRPVGRCEREWVKREEQRGRERGEGEEKRVMGMERKKGIERKMEREIERGRERQRERASNIMQNNYILSSASEELGHRSLHYKGESGVYLSPHMYTSIYYAEAQVLFQDGVYWRLVYQLAARDAPLFHKRGGGNQFVFPPGNIQITHAVSYTHLTLPTNREV